MTLIALQFGDSLVSPMMKYPRLLIRGYHESKFTYTPTIVVMIVIFMIIWPA